MKFFHLSDLHIGLKLMNRDLSEDQIHIFNQIVRYAGEEQPDAVVFAGDIYDKALPSAEAVRIFDDFIHALRSALPHAKLMLISGNHDSAQRLNTFRGILQEQNVYMVGLPPKSRGERIEKVICHDTFGNINFYLLPFVKPSMVGFLWEGDEQEEREHSYDAAVHLLLEREQISGEERNVLVSHQFYLPAGQKADAIARMDSEVVTVGNIDAVNADVLEQFDYAALGHIHKPMPVGSEYARYCGTPLACSVSEAGQRKSIRVVELKEKGSCYQYELPLIPLRQIRTVKGTLAQVLKESSQDYTTVVLEEEAPDAIERLIKAFPNLLEVRREGVPSADIQDDLETDEELSAMELCRAFLSGLDEEEERILQEIINEIGETI